MNVTALYGALAMMVLSCAVPADSAKPVGKSTTPAKWSVDFTTTGGFTGRGQGTVKITSDGAIVAGDITRTCNGVLTAAERRQITDLVTASESETWKESYARPENPYGAADQFGFALTLETDGRTKSTSWYEEVADKLPPNLNHLRNAAWLIRQRVVSECATK